MMMALIIAVGLITGIFVLGIVFVRPVLRFCKRHAIDANRWLLRLVGGWVLIWVGGSFVMRRLLPEDGLSSWGYKDNSYSILITLAALSLVWYVQLWFRLKKAPKGDLFEDQIDEIGNMGDKD